MKLIYIAITACMLFAASITKAAPIDVTFSTSGSAGAWLTDFSFTNNLGDPNDIYFFGVQAPTTTINPGEWYSSVNFAGLGGSSTIYNNNWYTPAGTNVGILPGQTLSDLDVLFNTIDAPTSVAWFAFSYSVGGSYDGSGCFYCGSNAGFEGVAGGSAPLPPITPVPEPGTYAMLLAGLGLLGYTARLRKQIPKLV